MSILRQKSLTKAIPQTRISLIGRWGGIVKRKSRALHEKQRPATKAKCTHYWVIESPQGPTSLGRCKFCGSVSEFSNYVPYPTWEGKVTRFPKPADLSDLELEEGQENS
jgi:hypothetical protein